MLLMRCSLVLFVCSSASVAVAGSLSGKLELPPPPDRPPVKNKGFLDRVDNPLAPVRPLAVAPNLAVVLEGEDKPQAGGNSVTWELAGDSFARPVLAVPVGTEVVIKNTSKSARMIAAAEDGKLIPAGLIQAGSPKSFRPTEAKAYTLGDAAVPYLKGKLVVVDTKFVASVDDTGKFDIADIPAGTYKLRVYFFQPATGKDGWIERPDESVTISAKGKSEITAKLPAGYPIQKGK